MNESVKKSLEKSQNVLEEKRKIVKRKICIKKTHTFTIIAMNFVQKQLVIDHSNLLLTDNNVGLTTGVGLNALEQPAGQLNSKWTIA